MTVTGTSLQTAIVEGTGGEPILSHDVPIPTLGPSEVLVETKAVAINPSDHKMSQKFPSAGAIVGSDFAGTVVKIGSGVAQLSRPLAIGDRVCGAVHGCNPADPHSGAFAQYVKADGSLVMKVPESMAWEEAATLGVALGTTCISFWKALGLSASPSEPAATPFPVLVYGGSTAMGTMAVQVLKLSGLTPIATSSPKNFNLVKSFGAKQVFDYASPTCAADIKSFTNNSLKYALDCITDADSTQICHTAIGRAGGRYACLELPQQELLTRKAVNSEFVMAHELHGKEIALGPEYGRPGSQAAKDLGIQFFRVAEKLLEENKIRAHPVHVLPNGWKGILEGFTLLKSGQVNARKLVAPLGQ
ncbi:Polyketide synthase enoylreductase [Penicillium sp. CMV-2018d]|nr:Polyketide synthase enoylreductase [Penicillium sp. CMV-2018d]